MKHIELLNLHKSFGPKHILRGASLGIEKAETMVILGGSGTGKSVLLKCLLGLEKLDSGEIHIDGKPTHTLHGEARMELMTHFGMLFQGAALFDSMPVWENIAFLLLRRGMTPKQAKAAAIEKLEMVGLKPEVADQAPSSLSGGQRKRVGLARAIAHSPQIILYDEPTTGLDPVTSDVINNLILQTQKNLGCTSIVITHDMTSAFKVANRMAFLKEGQFLEVGTPKDFRTTANTTLRNFIEGRAETNE